MWECRKQWIVIRGTPDFSIPALNFRSSDVLLVKNSVVSGFESGSFAIYFLISGKFRKLSAIISPVITGLFGRYLFVLVRQAVSSSHEFHMLYQIRSFHMLLWSGSHNTRRAVCKFTRRSVFHGRIYTEILKPRSMVILSALESDERSKLRR